MAEESMKMPSSFGGLVRYFDEYKSKIEMKPSYIIAAIVVFILFEIIIRL